MLAKVEAPAGMQEPTVIQKADLAGTRNDVDAVPVSVREKSSLTTGGASSDNDTRLQRQRCWISRRKTTRQRRLLEEHPLALLEGSSLLEQRVLCMPVRQRYEKDLTQLRDFCQKKGAPPGPTRESGSVDGPVFQPVFLACCSIERRRNIGRLDGR